MQLRRILQLAVTSNTTVSQLLGRPNPRHPLPIVIPTLVLALASLLAFAVPPASAQINCELHEKGFWRNNPLEWPVDSLQLGTKTYNQQDLLTILATRVGGDASVMLAQ